MHVRFWGTRGSLAKPGPTTMRYGGNTSCVELRSNAGTRVVIDCGTGAHDLGQAIMRERGKPQRGYLLISHTHWDHIQGIPFFAPFFAPDQEWDVYAPHNLDQSIRDTLAGQMQYTYFPVSLEALGANIRYHDLVEGTFELDDITVRTRYLNHPALTLGYRFEVDGVAMVYSCDHEQYPRESDAGGFSGQNLRHVNFLKDADLVIHDAQYREVEYPEKVGWGHSTAEYAVEVCLEAGARQLALTHHDPLRTDDEVDEIISALSKKLQAAGEDLRVFGAAEGQQINLQSENQSRRDVAGEWFSAVEAVLPEPSDRSVLLCANDPALVKLVSEAATEENLQLTTVASTEAALTALAKELPSLVLIDEQSGIDEAVAICRRVKELSTSETPQPPIILISDGLEAARSLVPYTTERLVKPFSLRYMRTRMLAWVMRRTCRWIRARQPDDEAARLAALEELGILDTEPEERFDGIVRQAAAALDVPIALVSLVDRNRQWFKACLGVDATETPRDMAFCAHAILEKEVLIVPDTFLDPRFADNPLVTGDVRVRFYAGCPVNLPDGHPVGTLCVIDSRPREFDSRQVNLLKKFARLVEAELAKQPQVTE